MPLQATRRALTMTLRQLVDRYCALVPEFGQPVALAAFQLTPAETEGLFSAFDEDYHISRFLHFSEGAGEKYAINGVAATHVSLDAEIETIL
ncbi:MAG TPA: hypothetical protein VJN93_10750 [Candidatus Acidoferrum sp.]|nr:hypothetical protein [Candidatus Acidoferrum sp.]